MLPGKAVVLLSGGLDSATVLYAARQKGCRCFCLTFDYGQRHRREIQSAKAVARAAGVPCKQIRLRFPWGGGALTDPKQKVPLRRAAAQIGRGIPSTYVPARNTIFLALALGYAESIGAQTVFIGAHALDYSGYPDCRPSYLQAMRRVYRLGTKSGVQGTGIRLKAPLVRMNKAKIIQLGKRLGVPYAMTWSCYLGRKQPCGRCDSCLLRGQGFQEAGVQDPLLS